MNNKPIGVFDSGIGGLTIVKEIVNALPNESIIYLGDTARVPYGTRSKEVITSFALELVDLLLRQDVKILVVACNTISATCLNKIRKVSPVPVIEVIEPAVKEAVRLSRTKSIGVIGTCATVNSRAYNRKIKKLNAEIKVFSKACPLFVLLAEKGIKNHSVITLIAKKYLKFFTDTEVDTLILGCTHYPLFRQIIQKILGPEIFLVDPAKGTTMVLKEKLFRNALEAKTNNPKYKYYVTGDPEKVTLSGKKIFGKDVPIFKLS